MIVDHMPTFGCKNHLIPGWLCSARIGIPSSAGWKQIPDLQKRQRFRPAIERMICGAVPVLLLCLCITFAQAQAKPVKLTFALPEHPGRMTLGQGAWQVVELSAKSNGNEFGVRATQGKQHMLAFLFVVPKNPSLNATSCRDEGLRNEHAEAAVINSTSIRSASGVEIAIAVLVGPKDASMSLRAFVASGDLCGDLLFNAADVHPGDKEAYRLTMETAKQTLQTLTFDPGSKPTFQDAFDYANVEYAKHQYAGAAAAYRAALTMVSQSEDPVKFRRVVTDQLAMSLGISGDLKGSRDVNEAAIAKDPEYPLYYYNLACADAEAGDPGAARTHLQQAFDRRAHLLKGEPFPDPTEDDSLQKLRKDEAFWSLARQLSEKIKLEKKS
jgi:tetratricopeptide (TPR) repeat protein